MNKDSSLGIFCFFKPIFLSINSFSPPVMLDILPKIYLFCSAITHNTIIIWEVVHTCTARNHLLLILFMWIYLNMIDTSIYVISKLQCNLNSNIQLDYIT